MAIEDFKHLIEAQSLEKKIKEHQDAVDEQLKRVAHIEKLRNRAIHSSEELTERLTQLNNLISTSEKELFVAEGKYQKTNEHIPLARNEQETNALENELKNLSPQIESLQENILKSMQEEEDVQKEIEETKEYIEGSSKSLEKIKTEVEDFVKIEKQQILNLEERVSALLEQAGPNLKNSYLLSNKDHKFNNPLCFVHANACHICRYTLNQIQAQEIEKGIAIESCPGCGRLLTPLSAKTL